MKYYVSDNLTTLLVNIEKLHYDKVEELRKEIKELKADNVVAVADERVIKELEDKLRELQAEAIEQIKDNKELQAENENLFKGAKKRDSRIVKLIAENESLQDQLKECVSDYDNDIKASYELDDTHIEIIKRLEAEIKDLRKGCKLLKDTSHYPKEYKAEADEYFHHVPEAKEVYFFMLSEWEMKDAERGDLCIEKDNAICVIDNTERSN